MNYFELFSLPERPVVDKSELSRKYIVLQKKYHPDYHTDSTEEEKDEMLEVSSAVNKAYLTFKDDQKTIAYFLQIKGLLEEEEKYNLPSGFLMEMMEVNELLDEGDIEKVRSMVHAMENEMDGSIRSVLEGITENSTAAEFSQIKDYYFRKKYLRRILDRLND